MWIKSAVLLCLIAVSLASDDNRAAKKKDESRGKRNLQYSIAHHYTVPYKPPDRRIATGYTLPLYYPSYFPGPRPYTPYHKDASNHLGKPEDLLTDTNHITENVYGPPVQHVQQIQHTKIIEKPVYIKEPEPIIEIIIKESNVTLPPPPEHITLAPKKKKEEVQVFYVKYKKNPNGHGKNSIIYDKPVPAISPPVPDEPEEEIHNEYPPQEYHHETVTQLPLPSTTHRTIIKPDSEVYHSPTGVKVTFGKEGFDYSKRSSKPDDYLRDSRPRVHSPFSQGRQLQSFPPNFGRPPSGNFEASGEFNFESQRIPQPYRPFSQSPPQHTPQSRPGFSSRPPSESSHSRFPSFQSQLSSKGPFSRQPFSSHPPASSQFHQNIQFPQQSQPAFNSPARQPVPYKPFENVRNPTGSGLPHPTASTIQFRPEAHFPIRTQPAQPFHNIPPPTFTSPNIQNHRFQSPVQSTQQPGQQHFGHSGSLDNHQVNQNHQRPFQFQSNYQTINHQPVVNHQQPNRQPLQVSHQPANTAPNHQPLNHNHQIHSHQPNKQQSSGQALNHQANAQTFNHQPVPQHTVNHQPLNHQPSNHQPPNYQSVVTHQQLGQPQFKQQPLNHQPSPQISFQSEQNQQTHISSLAQNHQPQQTPNIQTQHFNQQFSPQLNTQNSGFQQSREINHPPGGELIPSLSKYEQHISVSSEEQSPQIQYDLQQTREQNQGSQRENQQQSQHSHQHIQQSIPQQNNEQNNQQNQQQTQQQYNQTPFQQQPAQSFSAEEYNHKIKEQLENSRFLGNNGQQYQQQKQPERPRFINPGLDGIHQSIQQNKFNQNLNDQSGSKEEPEINLVYATPKPTNYYQTTSRPTASPEPSFNIYRSTTSRPAVSSTTPQPTTAAPAPSTTTKDPKILEAELPDEVPEDLRAQLLSSGILNHASISVLDYDKVGDIPLSALPPDQLANFFSAGGGQQIAAGSEQITSVVKHPEAARAAETADEEDQEMEGSDIDEVKVKQGVQMKVVHYDPRTQQGQQVEQSYLQDDATTLDPVVLNGQQYNKYLPLKVNGSTFPIPDVPELRGRKITSVVVLAPVAYDFSPQRKIRQAEERIDNLELIQEETLKDLVKNPTEENYNRFLESEKKTRSDKQSVILLVTGTGDRNDKEIFMYDVATKSVSKLAGELSTAFVEAAEANAKEATEDNASNIIEGEAEPEVAASNLEAIKVPLADPNEELAAERSDNPSLKLDEEKTVSDNS